VFEQLKKVDLSRKGNKTHEKSPFLKSTSFYEVFTSKSAKKHRIFMIKI